MKFINVFLTALCILGLCSCVLGSQRRYDGYRIVDITPTESSQSENVEIFTSGNSQIDVWDFPSFPGATITLACSNDYIGELTSFLVEHGISYTIRHQEVQQLIDEEAINLLSDAQQQSRSGRVDFNLDTYHDHSEINAYLTDIVSECDICQTINIGQSYEGREMLVFKIGQTSPGKSGIWIDAGIHAREWVSPAAALFIIDKLVLSYRINNTDVMDLLNSYVWYILPSANPDGYTYSRTTDRMWRKTMKPVPGSDCIGTDPNRNWDFHWNEVGSSDDPCRSIYAGPRPFSEPETVAISNFLLKMRGRVSLYISFHAYGQYWLSPWGYDTELPEDHEDLMRVGQAGVDRIFEVSGRHYTLGPIASVMYPSAGSSADWAKAVAGIKYAYGAELRDLGEYGFLLPARLIRPTGREIWQSVIAMAQEILLIES